MLDARLASLALTFSALAILMWGCWGFFGKLGLERGMPPFAILFSELLVGGIGAAVLLVLALIRHGGLSPAFHGWNVFGILSGLGLLLGLVFFYLALARESVTLVVPLTATYPAVSVILSYVGLGERPTPVQWTGLVLVVVGAGFLLSGPHSAAPSTR